MPASHGLTGLQELASVSAVKLVRYLPAGHTAAMQDEPTQQITETLNIVTYKAGYAAASQSMHFVCIVTA